MTKWTPEQVAACFCSEMHDRFELENQLFEQYDANSRKTISAENLEKLRRAGVDVDRADRSFHYECWKECRLVVEGNIARCTMPSYIRADFLEMFADCEVSWSLPALQAIVIDGVPHLQIEIMLIDYWDNARSAAWRLEHPWPPRCATWILRCEDVTTHPETGEPMPCRK